MPTARTGGWQCLSGPDPLTAASLAWGPWEDGVGWVAGALELKCPLCQCCGMEAGPQGWGRGREWLLTASGPAGWGRRGHNCPKLASPTQRPEVSPRLRLQAPCLQGGDQGHTAGGSESRDFPRHQWLGHSLCPSELTFFGQNKSADPSEVWKPVPSAAFPLGVAQAQLELPYKRTDDPSQPSPHPYVSKHLLQPRPHPEGKLHMAWNPLKQESKPCDVHTCRPHLPTHKHRPRRRGCVTGHTHQQRGLRGREGPAVGRDERTQATC